MSFIDDIAKYVIKHAPKYGIKVYSPIIAQAILESGNGKSELAVNANNYFGLKYKAGRCPTASGTYAKIGSEQNPDGSYVSSAMCWCKFKDIESCVIGYLDFVNHPRYVKIKGVEDPKTYLQYIKDAGYATSLKYVDNCMNIITRYGLTKYDPVITKETPKEEQIQDTKKYYRVICGSYKNKSQAESKIALLASKNIKAIVKPYNDVYRVQVCACIEKYSAEAIQRSLKELSFDSFIAYC